MTVSEGLFAADEIEPTKPSSEIVTAQVSDRSLIALVQKAASQLASATSAAEVLEAKEYASVAYDASKKAARLAKAKGAHDELIAKAHRAQADALQIESEAKRRLADEYDAAQDRGEVRGSGINQFAASKTEAASAADIGLTHKDIHEARQIRDAEKIEPGIVQRVVEEKLASGQEPTKAALRDAVKAVVTQSIAARNPASHKNPHYTGPDPKWDAMLAVSAGCRDIMEKAGNLEPAFILSGFVDEAQRGRNLAVIEKCRDFLTSILETANA